MVPPVSPRNRNEAVRSRDEALVRIRRATIAMGLTATVAATGIGAFVAGASVHHASTATPATGSATGSTATTSTSGSGGASTSTTTAPTSTTTPVARTTSGQS